MYDFLEGQVAGRTAARLVLDVHGVGYELLVPLTSSFPAAGKLKVWTHLVVREDSQQLFGFRDAATRDAFRALLGVTSVGPKVALAVLSGLTSRELAAAVAANDAERLTTVRGVGRRIAEQILLDLRGKLAALVPAESEGLLVPQARPDQRHALEDAITALISIGYPEKDARRQVERAAKSVDPSNLELLVRTALSS
ncbi:MAG: Holliday junction branch migration protein RuvA [Planctomycetes bacterium]|nr:Holliday junction branch migration protein RuvA [Planctomycetota bacterium]